MLALKPFSTLFSGFIPSNTLIDIIKLSVRIETIKNKIN